MTAPEVRTLTFEYPDDFNPQWHPRLPEFAATANAVSLLMPHVEPYVAKSVRSVISQLPAELAEEAAGYVGQELQHHRQHQRFNRFVVEDAPAIGRVDKAMAAVIGWLARTRSTGFHLGFAAAFETIAYAGARWVDKRAHALLRGSDPMAASLFLWHLAEEVEHKSVAFDVFKAVNGQRRKHMAGAVVALLVLGLFTMVNAVVLLAKSGRMLRPATYVRMATWTVSFTFDFLPALVVSTLAGHHPSSLVDPGWMTTWLASYDAETGTLPYWNDVPLARGDLASSKATP